MSIENLIAKEILGIDPGIGGAIAKYDGKIEVTKMPKFDELCDYFDKQKEICKLPLIFLEKVQLRPGDSDRGKQFKIEKMLRQYTELLTVIKTRKIFYIEVHPVTWQTYLRIKIGGEDRSVRKRRYADIAREKYPQVKVTLQNADSLLLVEFGRMKLKYDSLWILRNVRK